jgi:hypothetical protein
MLLVLVMYNHCQQSTCYDILKWTGVAQSVDLYLTIKIISLFETNNNRYVSP